jgi:TfoX/Sxy family transcriptional regulator of competence genes
MAVNEFLTDRVRQALEKMPRVAEKKMFHGISFMVNDKMCISVRDEEIMCRIDPAIFEMVLEKNGVRPMVHAGKTMKGFVFVHQSVINRQKEFDYWIDLCLTFNKKAKSSKKK